MTRLVNDPAAFADEAAEGFARAFAPWVRRVRGGVVRSAPAGSEVAVVIGGGSGHYPAFAGLVGPGGAHGAVMGNVFASPSAQQAHAVARAVETGRGVLLSYGNYAGDVLNFDAAQKRLRAEGIGCETVVVTDDISSAPADRVAERRGIAGGLVVYKTAGAASARGLALSEVTRLARKANDRTRTLGVAFGGCSLPGADRPLFTVPDGRMAIGMGVHGEPGIGETDVPTARGLAELLVGELLKERAGDRAAVILNGLGAVKYEELFVVYASVADLLTGAGVSIVEPEVGELVTSFDMAGVSLTLCWLDDELEDLWRAPASTPAFRKGVVAAAEPPPWTPAQAAQGRPDTARMPAQAALGTARMPAKAARDTARTPVQAAPPGESQTTPPGESVAIPPADGASRRVAVAIRDALTAARTAIESQVDELGRLDAIAGDGDHGIGMRRGVLAATEAAAEAVQKGAGAGTTLRRAGDAWGDRAGGTSGALWAAALAAAGEALGDGAPSAHAGDTAPSAHAAEVLGGGAPSAHAAEAQGDSALSAGPAHAGARTAVPAGIAGGEAVGSTTPVPAADGEDAAGPSGAGRALARAVDAAASAVLSAGGAVVGDRTLVDVLVPFRDAVLAAARDGADPVAALAAAVPVAESAARATADLVPRKGRAKTHAARSMGSPDPGATSLALVLRAAADSIDGGTR